MADERITVKEAAEILEITESGVINAIKRGSIEAEKFGRDWAVSKASVLHYRDTRKGTGPRK